MPTVDCSEVSSFLEQVENYPTESAESKTGEQVLSEKERHVVTVLQQRYGNRPDEQARFKISRMVHEAANQLMKIPVLAPQSASHAPMLVEAVRHHTKIKEYARVILSLFFGQEPWHRSRCWRCNWRVYATTMDRCPSCTWVICQHCRAGEYNCSACTELSS